VLFVLHWVAGLIALVPLAGLLYFSLREERAFRNDLKDYVLTLSHRVKKAGNGVIQHLPIGMLLYNDQYEIEWHNPYMCKVIGKDSAAGEDVKQMFPMLQLDQKEQIILFQKEYYKVLHNADERLIYFTNVTAFQTLSDLYRMEKLAIGIVMLDNLEEATQGLDD